MPNILELFGSLTPLQLGVGLPILAAILAIVLDWRLAMVSMLVQYLLVSLLLALEVPQGIATIKLLSGAVTCMILYWTARRIEQGLDRVEDGRAWFRSNREIYPMGLPFRFLALIFISLVLYTLPERFSFVLFPREFLVPAMWLMAMGLLTIILTRDPLKTGLGLLAFQNGFELLYTLIEPSLSVVGLLGISTILVGLAASYLAVARHLPLIEAQQAIAPVPDPRTPEALAEAVAALEQRPVTPPMERVPREEQPA
jgi:hypothetical protein